MNHSVYIANYRIDKHGNQDAANKGNAHTGAGFEKEFIASNIVNGV